MKITTIGIDLTKEVFQVNCVDSRGKVLLRKQFYVVTRWPNFSPI
jgi:hypothetical protein